MEGRAIMSFLKGIGLGDVLGTISPGLGAITGKGLGADLLPMLSPLMGMLTGHHDGGHEGGAGPIDPGMSSPTAQSGPAPNFAASGLGHALGVDPSRVASIAGTVGSAANQIAAAGGAQGGYQNPGVQGAALPTVNNHLQMLDPQVLRALIQHFSGQRP
jgi:hypothetical protein